MAYTFEPARKKTITVRLLDVGGDKNLHFLDLPPDPSPFLGRRGVRLLLEYPDLLCSQLKAILSLSKEFNLRILVPMVTLIDDMIAVRNILCKAATDMGIKTPPPLGAMIETPAAALCINSFLDYADFFSIGTNDLAQYTMAAGRENVLASKYFIDDHPAIFNLLHIIAENIGDKPTSICGELAGNANAIANILCAGFKSISVAAPLVPAIKETVRNTRIYK